MITRKTTFNVEKFANKNKIDELNKLLFNFKLCVENYIDLILNDNLPLKQNLNSKLLPSIIFQHSQWKQIAYKEASSIIRSCLRKTRNNCYKKYKKLYAKCKKENKHQKFLSLRFSNLKINYLKRIKINLNKVSIKIDNRLFDIFENPNSFNYFIKIRLPWFKVNKKIANSIKIPLNDHKHSLKFKDWKRKNTIILRKNENGKLLLDFIFEKEKVPKKEIGKIIGVDIGYKKLVIDSDGEIFDDGLEEIYKKISNKKQGSKKFKKLLKERDKLINQSLNKMKQKLINVNKVVVEDLKNVKKKSKGKIYKKVMNKLQRWSYSKVLNKLSNLAEELGFNLVKIDPNYTSQTCSKCGYTCKNSRKNEFFKCKSCGYEIDADLNAAINICNRGAIIPLA